jgi:hypothetical protein
MRGKSTYARRNPVGSVLCWTVTVPWLDLLYLAVCCLTSRWTMLIRGSMRATWEPGTQGSMYGLVLIPAPFPFGFCGSGAADCKEFPDSRHTSKFYSPCGRKPCDRIQGIDIGQTDAGSGNFAKRDCLVSGGQSSRFYTRTSVPGQSMTRICDVDAHHLSPIPISSLMAILTA